MDYFDMPPEQLLGAEVMSVSKRTETVSDSPAAVYVITREDILRAGIMTIPDALRMAPGVQVAQSDANSWSVSIRGFNGALANKLLVLIDGRTVYTPLYGGTYWEAQDLLLNDIDRIEVIRGPGGALWGANAVNGVINIITKSAVQTQGNVVTAAYGTHDNGTFSGRHGGSFGENDFYRVYLKTFDRGNHRFLDGSEADDDWKSYRSGFRADWNEDFTLQGDIYRTFAEQRTSVPDFSPSLRTIITPAVKYDGANILGRWKQKHDDGALLTVQSYLDYSKREEDQILNDERVIFDLEGQYDLAQRGAHQITVGGGYRYTVDHENGTDTVSFDPQDESDNIFSAFVQDKITLVPEQWYLTLGSKFEHNDFSGFEFQPNARLQWHPDLQQTVWAAVSRAVRTPTRLERDITLRAQTTASPAELTIVGNEDFDSEELTAYELGYRNQITPKFSIDTTAFYNDYDKLAAFRGLPSFAVAGPPARTFFPFVYENAMSGEAYGIELAATWSVRPNWTLSATYSYLDLFLHQDADLIINNETGEDIEPHHQAGVRSSWNINDKLTLDTNVYYVDEQDQQDVDSYARLDINLGWKINENIHFNVVGQNLLEDRHREFDNPASVRAAEIERSILGKLTWQF